MREEVFMDANLRAIEQALPQAAHPAVECVAGLDRFGHRCFDRAGGRQ